MLNALLTRAGKQIGIIITKGHEQSLMHERSFQIHAGYGYSDKSHKVTHIHNEPYVPLKYIRGVTERMGPRGEEFIPLYEHEVKQAAKELLEKEITGIVILFLCSYANPAHERRAAEIVREVMSEQDKELPLFLSSELAPIMREVSRLNCLVLEGMGAQPVRSQLLGIEKRLRDKGFRYPLQIVLADGGIANIRFPALHRACFSGPIGGLLGTAYLSKEFDMPNIVSSDLGGTSFDVGLVTGGELMMLREVETGRQLINIPTIFMDSIGAGAGQYLRINPESKRLDIGPGSAGADPGPVFYNMGNETPTVIDCALILGIVNPDYYLGGKVKVYKKKAFEAIKKQCSDVLGMDPYVFSEMVMELINTRMREHIKSAVTLKGFALDDYYLLSFGGAGPLFMSGYSEGLQCKGVFTVPWASAFSAFGSVTADYLHRYQHSCLIGIPPKATSEQKMQAANGLNTIWADLEKIATGEMAEEGFKRDEIKFEQIAYIRYAGQLDDLEVISPTRRINSPEDMDKLLTAFEDKYTQVYTYGSRHAEAGFQIFEAGLRASIAKPKPRIIKYPVSGKIPPAEAYKGERLVYLKGEWKAAKLYEMDLLDPGNEIEGLAIIEAPATTLPVHPGKKIVIDEFKRFWLREA